MRKYIKANYDYSKYQNKLDDIINNSKTVRERVVNIAKFMAYDFPKLPYFWGGGHLGNKKSKIGLDKTWGKMKKLSIKGSTRYNLESFYPYSMDCSSFVSWCLINAGYNLDKYVVDFNNEYCLDSKDFERLGSIYLLTSNNIRNVIRPGDLVWKSGHIGIIINYYNNEIDIAHISGVGEGMNITTINLIDGKIFKDDFGELPLNYEPSDPVRGDENRKIGGYLFTHVILVDYE